MIAYLIPLVASFITGDVCNELLYPLFCIYFVAAVPSIFRAFTRWR